MNKYSEKEDEFNLLPEPPIDLLGILIKYISYWKWFVLSLIVCVAVAATYLKFTLPSYGIKTSVLIKDDVKGSGSVEMSVFKDMSIITQKNSVDNELELLKNSLIFEKVVRELGVYATYYQISTLSLIQKLGINKLIPGLGKYRSYVLYGDESPILVTLPDSILKNFNDPVSFQVLVHPDGRCEFTGTYNENPYTVHAFISDKEVKLPFGRINLRKSNLKLHDDMQIEVNLENPMTIADQFLKQIKMELASKGSSVVNLSMVSSNVALGKDFLRKFIEVYNLEEMNDQLEMANKTSQLIEEHLNSLSKELNTVESQAENYKQSQGITDLAAQSDIYNAQTADAQQKRLELETQLGIVSNLKSYVQNNQSHDQLLPANSGIKSSGLNDMISNYNKLVLDKNRLSRIASGSNQAMVDLNNKIENTYNTV